MSTANPTTKKCIRGHEYVSPRVPSHRPCQTCRSDIYEARKKEANLERPTLVERFYANVTLADVNACWPWRGSTDVYGYGRLKVGGVKVGEPKRTVKAHRFSYELNVGPIPDGLTLDHVKARGCTMRHCVNPSHLEPVTDKVNILRGDAPSALFARRMLCPRGHGYTQYNGYRRCHTCLNEKERRERAAKREARAS